MAAATMSRSYRRPRKRRLRSLASTRDSESRPAWAAFLLARLGELLAPVDAPRAGTELGDEQRAAQHGEVLHEHHHLHLVHHGIGYAPAGQ